MLVRSVTHFLPGHKLGAMDLDAAVGLIDDEKPQSGFLSADSARKVHPRIGTSRDCTEVWERDQRTRIGWIRLCRFRR